MTSKKKNICVKTGDIVVVEDITVGSPLVSTNLNQYSWPLFMIIGIHEEDIRDLTMTDIRYMSVPVHCTETGTKARIIPTEVLRSKIKTVISHNDKFREIDKHRAMMTKFTNEIHNDFESFKRIFDRIIPVESSVLDRFIGLFCVLSPVNETDRIAIYLINTEKVKSNISLFNDFMNSDISSYDKSVLYRILLDSESRAGGVRAFSDATGLSWGTVMNYNRWLSDGRNDKLPY